MPLLKVQTEINADLKTCFDLARDIGFYQKSIKKSNEIPIGGKVSGLVEANDLITWEANHLGFVKHITLEVTEFKEPVLFVDEIVHGDFKAYRHEHIFQKSGNQTIMIDNFFFESGNGLIGRLKDWLFLKKYMLKSLKSRNKILKDIAERNQNALIVV